MGEAPLWVAPGPALVSLPLRMETSWSKALGAPHQQRMKGLDRAHHTMHVQPLWSLKGPGNVKHYITGVVIISCIRGKNA